MIIISSNVLNPNPITCVQPTCVYIYGLGHCTHNTLNLGLMHTKTIGLFDFEPTISYYIDNLFADAFVDYFKVLPQFELAFVILLCSACFGHASNIFLICSMS